MEYSNGKGLVGSASRFWRCGGGERGEWVSSTGVVGEGMECVWGDCKSLRRARILGSARGRKKKKDGAFEGGKRK